MTYFVPDLRLANELSPQQAPEDKLGGLPWGLPPSLWPTCMECGKHQSLLAQFLHHEVRLNLGKPGRILSVFQCCHNPGLCETWSGSSGANACIITEPEQISNGLAPLPEDAPPIEVEARIVGWIEHPEGAPWNTRLGGVPSWVQGEDEAPDQDWRFIGQLDSTYSFFQAPKLPHEMVYADAERYEGRSHFCEGPNFGDGGIGYVFVRNLQSSPEGYFFGNVVEATPCLRAPA